MSVMTQSLEDYLEAIYVRIAEGRPAQVRDIARRLSVKMPSVVKAVRELKKLELVTQEPYSAIELTPKGERLASHIGKLKLDFRRLCYNQGAERNLLRRGEVPVHGGGCTDGHVADVCRTHDDGADFRPAAYIGKCRQRTW